MTTGQTSSAEAFIARIETLDNGNLASLRRGCGKASPVEGRCPWFLGEIQGAASESTSFLVASLLAQHKTSDIRAKRHRGRGNFGATWKQAIRGTSSESLPRRFHIVLDAEFDPVDGSGDLPYRLRQLVRYAVQKGIGSDWPSLLRDLSRWNLPGKPVQKAWARSFFAKEPTEDTPNPEEVPE